MLCVASVYSIYLCSQPNNSNRYFSFSLSSVELISKQANLHPGASKDGMWSYGRFSGRCTNTPFLFHLATGQHKYHSTASKRHCNHEEETGEHLKIILANSLILHLLKEYYCFLKAPPTVPLSTAVTQLSTQSHTQGDNNGHPDWLV